MSREAGSGLTVLWDNDGVLVDTEGLFFRATQIVLRSVGVALSPEQFIDCALNRGRSTFQFAAERGVSPDGIDALRADRDRLYAEWLRTTECVVEGVDEVLRRLHGRVGMGVVTSSRREHFEILHDRTGFLPFFGFVITREDYAQTKPHLDPYLTALRRHHLRPEDCVVIEDSERGLSAALAAGLRCIMVPGEWTRQGNFAGALKVLGGIAEIPDEIFRLAASAGTSWHG